MKILSIQAPSGRRGVALLYAVFGAFVIAAMVSIMLAMASVTNDEASNLRYTTQAQYLAEGAVEVAKKQIQDAIANWEDPPAAATATIGGIGVDYTIETDGVTTIVTDPAGIQTLVQSFEVEADATVEGYRGHANRVINAESTPIFQFAVFYDDDLEIFPGPSMNLGGRVHTNADMFLGSGGTLSMDTNYVHAAGDMYRRRKDGAPATGTVEIRKWVENPYDPAQPSEFATMYSQSQMQDDFGISTPSGFDSDFGGFDSNDDDDYDDLDEWLPFAPGALEFWQQPDGYTDATGNTVLTGAHGVAEAVPPDLGSIAMYEEVENGGYEWDDTINEFIEAAPGSGTHAPGFFHANAELSIIVADDGLTWTAFDGDGNDVSVDLVGAVTLSEIYDARQSDGAGALTPVVQIDLELVGASGHFPANGLLYASHYGMGPGTEAKGVQLTNGAELQSHLTVVGEGSLYVQGDYNSVNKKSASVIADAVGLLSNAWDGTKALGDLPSATATSYNMGIITGNHDTAAGSYNGGLENLPRFHERWSGVPCNISGSFVNTWQSNYATGIWGYGGDRYTAPIRNWGYDTMFNNVANLPPFTPMVVSAQDVVSW